MNSFRLHLVVAGLFLLLITECSSSEGNREKEHSVAATTMEENLPLTMGNIRGHRKLYNEGWFFVTSSRRAFAYAHEKGIISSREALSELKKKLARSGQNYDSSMKEGKISAAELLRDARRQGAENRQQLNRASSKQGEELLQSGARFSSDAWDFVTGGIYYGERTPEYWQKLKGVLPGYYKDLKSDLSNIVEINQIISEKFETRIEAEWEPAFARASQEFRREYEESGESDNTFMALGNILRGYLKSFYYGLAKPSAKSIVAGGSYLASRGSYIFTPIAGSLVVGARTVQSSGLSLYYLGGTTVHMMAPTLEAGFLTALGMGHYLAGYGVKAGGRMLGLANQVAFTTAGVVGASTLALTASAAETGKYVARVSYDVGRATTKVAINQGSSAVVLGYNALSALPTHLFMLPFDTVALLALDGPRLVIISARGLIKDKQGGATSIDELPVGTVVDVKKMEQRGVEVEKLTDDPEVIRRVFPEVFRDLNESEGELPESESKPGEDG